MSKCDLLLVYFMSNNESRPFKMKIFGVKEFSPINFKVVVTTKSCSLSRNSLSQFWLQSRIAAQRPSRQRGRTYYMIWIFSPIFTSWLVLSWSTKAAITSGIQVPGPFRSNRSGRRSNIIGIAWKIARIALNTVDFQLCFTSLKYNFTLI